MTSDAELRIELIERRADLPLSPEQWNALVTRNDTNTIFQTFEWFDAWWRTFGDAHELFFVAVYRGREVIGFAALMIRRTRMGLRQLEFVGTGNADYQDFVLPIDKQQVLSELCAFLAAHAGRWQRAKLCNIPSHSSTFQQIRAAGEAASLYLVDEAQQRCPTLVLEADRGAAWQLIGKYSLRRPLNWFKKRGEVRFRHVTSRQEIQALLPAFFDQHMQRWRAVGRNSTFEKAQQQTFYRALAHTMHAAGWLLFSVVEFNGEPIAFHYGFDYALCVTWYKPSFDVRYAEHSPGLLLTRQLIEDGLMRERREIDFTIGEETFKDRFANLERSNAYIGIYHGPVAYRIALWMRDLRRALGRFKRKLG